MDSPPDFFDVSCIYSGPQAVGTNVLGQPLIVSFLLHASTTDIKETPIISINFFDVSYGVILAVYTFEAPIITISSKIGFFIIEFLFYKAPGKTPQPVKKIRFLMIW